VAEIAKVSSVEEQAEQLSEVYYRFLKDKTSKLVRGTAFQNIGPFIAAFKKGSDIDTKIIDFYVTTTEGSSNKDVCYHASFNFPAFVLVFGSDEWPRFQSLYHKLNKINDPRIKKTLSASIHELAKILGPKYTEQDLLPCMEKFLKEKVPETRLLVLKNLHVFLEQLPEEKRTIFVKYIVQTFEEADKNEWRLKEILAQNIGNYAQLFDANTVYSEFLPMYFKFCSDLVVRVGLAACPALADILDRFSDNEHRLNGIVRVVRKRYFQSSTYKKRQMFATMCGGKLMNNKERFDKFFKHDFMSLVSDKVPNVRIAMAKVIRHHFLKEIQGVYVDDQEMNDTVNLLKQDPCEDVRQLVGDIETIQSDVTMESFRQVLESTRVSFGQYSEDESLNSEDEQMIEKEIRRHNSEDSIDHGPVLRSLRAARQRDIEREQEEKKMARAMRKKQKDMEDTKQMLEEFSDPMEA
jgi:serine/threonine-protein phosphatase 4 regulatory subunit 1